MRILLCHCIYHSVQFHWTVTSRTSLVHVESLIPWRAPNCCAWESVLGKNGNLWLIGGLKSPRVKNGWLRCDLTALWLAFCHATVLQRLFKRAHEFRIKSSLRDSLKELGRGFNAHNACALLPPLDNTSKSPWNRWLFTYFKLHIEFHNNGL